MNNFSLLVKPVSYDCNMSCSYCFYSPKKELYPDTKRHMMKYEVLDKLISGYLKTNQPSYIFGWQGGEPLLAGKEFFIKIIEYQQKYARSSSIISNGLQTNATLIDNDLAKHLSKYNFLLGVSLDGPENLHNRYRKLKNNTGSFKRVLKTIDILKESKVEFNTLTLVNDFNVSHPEEIYDFLVKNKLIYHQYIPCVEYDNCGNLKIFSINGKSWGDFLIRIFNKWYPHDIYKISIRLFDSILNRLVNGRATNCEMLKYCNNYFVVEYNGDIYPCDFFVEKELKIGNIMENTWDNILNSKIFNDFSGLKAGYNKNCTDCIYLDFCFGDCLKHRRNLVKGPGSLSTLCSGIKSFLDYSLPAFKQIAAEISPNI
ncbi:MAG: anaerobic sulfatase maturase [Actinobacteria bacterium]|nr:anaerobic sulfatase maturase [Actinomycetota bacterium]